MSFNMRSILLIVLLILLGCALYLPRLDVIPLRGESTRRATVAWEMIETGQWIVPQQQREPFLSRPPMHSWMIFATAWLRHGGTWPEADQTASYIDTTAVRLPSALGAIGLALVTFLAVRSAANETAGWWAGLAMLTFPHVMELGRLGETDVPFSFLLGSSILLWGAAASRGKVTNTLWMITASLAALATLTKGIQAPMYYFGSVWLWLTLTGRRRELVSLGHGLAVVVYAGIVAAWLIPFMLATSSQSVVEVFFSDVGHQLKSPTLIEYARHAVIMPVEIMVSLLPWAALLPAFASQRVRQVVARQRSFILFCVLACGVGVLPVLASPQSSQRHFMPLLPCVAGLIGVAAMGCCCFTWRDWPARLLRDFGRVIALIACIAGVAVGVLTTRQFDWLPPLWFDRPAWLHAGAGLLATLVAAGIWFTASRQIASRDVTVHENVGDAPQPSGIARRFLLPAMVACFLALIYVVPITSALAGGANDLEPQVAMVHEEVETYSTQPLVSFGKISHRFAYYWPEPIEKLDWPMTMEDVPDDLDYFCFGGGWEWNWKRYPLSTEDQLPFRWQPLIKISPHRSNQRDLTENTQWIVIGKALRDEKGQLIPARQ